MFAKKLFAPLAQALEEIKIESPKHYQKQAFSAVKSGSDLIYNAEGEDGKSTMVAISTVQILQKALNDVPRAIIFVPDEEKAHSLKTIFEKVAAHTDLRIFNVHGDGSMDDLKTQIYLGSDVVIGTPKRLGDLYNENVINLSDLKLFIIDDADLHTRQDANAQLERLSDSVFKAQILVFTHKINDRIERYADRFMGRVTILG